MAPTLQAAIELLYRTFAPYPLPHHTNPCPCCHTIEEEEALHAKPLRELEAADMNSYAFDALLTWGDERVFKHLLPRLYELYMAGPVGNDLAVDPEIVFSKFRHARWRNWPRPEQDAVETFLHAVWRDALVSTDPPLLWCDLEAWLCSIGQCEDSLRPYLEEWLTLASLPAMLALAGFIISDELGNDPFWEDRTEQKEQVRRWLRSEAVLAVLMSATDRFGAEYAETFRVALSVAGQD